MLTDLDALSDFDPSTKISPPNSAASTTTVTVELAEPCRPSHFFINYGKRRGNPQLLMIEAETANGWQTLGTQGGSGKTSVLTPESSQRFRVVFSGQFKAEDQISELAFYR